MQITDVNTASLILIKTLSKLGVDKIFGYPGSTILPIYEALSKQNKIEHILLCHEQNSVHAAEGYARVSGKCGVVLVTAGPGAANTITGILNAYIDGFPLIVLAGQVSSEVKGKGAFQEFNFAETLKSSTKASFSVTDISQLESTLIQAYLIAMSGKKGPVVIEIPKNVLLEECEYKNLVLPSDKQTTISSLEISSVVETLISSSNPIVVCGGGVVHSSATMELQKVASLLDIPVVSTMMGINGFSQIHPNYVGMIGLYGDKSANDLLMSSDTVIVLGARFNDRITSILDMENFNKKTIIQVDINSAELIRNLSVDIALNVDIKVFLNELLLNLPKHLNFEYSLSKSENINTVDKANSIDGYTTDDIFRLLYQYIGKLSPIISTEVGEHQTSLIRTFKFDETAQLLTSGGLGTMGFGFPSAIGAAFAVPDKCIVLVTGDGSFQMNLTELAVCAKYDLPVKILLINNNSLGMVAKLQDKLYAGNRFETNLLNPDFVKISEAYGIRALRVDSREEILPALQQAFAYRGPFLVDFITEL